MKTGVLNTSQMLDLNTSFIFEVFSILCQNVTFLAILSPKTINSRDLQEADFGVELVLTKVE